MLVSLVSGNVAAGQDNIDLNFQSVKLTDAFRALADIANMNIVVDSSVSGTTTVHLQQISFREAVDLLAKSSGLDYRIVNNTILVASSGKLDQGFGQKVTKVFKLKNSNPKELKGSLNLLVDDASIRVDNRTDSLAVTAYQSKLPEINSLINQLDEEKKQIIIQARIEEISHTGLEKLGVDWDFQKLTANGNSTTILDNEGETNTSENNNLNSNLSNFGDDLALNYLAMINMLEQNNHATNLANPQITTIDGKAATIDIGSQYPIVKPGGDGKTEVEFKDIGISLEIAPKITENNKVYMDVKPETSIVASTFETSDNITYPIIDTRKVETNVRVASGKTIAIGGLITKEERENLKKVPFLGDLPVFGKMFSSQSTETDKTELVIFLTPKIVGVPTESDQAEETSKSFDYQVQDGDSVWSIGNLFDISFAKILEYNDIQYVSNLKTGQNLKIPVPQSYYYKVQAEDSLAQLAERYDVNVAAIQKINNLSTIKDKSGQEIVIPAEVK
jgi:type IV pilus assembly protein PilQ